MYLSSSFVEVQFRDVEMAPHRKLTKLGKVGGNTQLRGKLKHALYDGKSREIYNLPT